MKEQHLNSWLSYNGVGKYLTLGGCWAGEIKVKIPKRPDQRYAMLSAIVHTMRQHENPEELLNGFFDIILQFPNDWAQLVHTMTLP